MLVKHKEFSDNKQYRIKTKYGRKDLKDAFIGAAESVLRTDSGLRKEYDRVHERTGCTKKAKKHIARKIASIALQVMKKGVPYDEKYLSQQTKN